MDEEIKNTEDAKEEKVSEAQTEEVKTEEPSMYDFSEEEMAEETEEPKKKGKMDHYVELILFLILGILIGVALKTEAAKRVTIGFNDYQMKIQNQDYSINKLQADMLKKQQDESAQNEAQPTPEENAENPADTVPDNTASPTNDQNAQ